MANSFVFSLLLVLFSLSSLLGKKFSSPPYIVKQPPTHEVLFQVEKPFHIDCVAIGEPAPKYRWVKNGKPFNWEAYDDRISQQHGRGTLTILEPRDDDVGQYQCFAENEHGIATSSSVFTREAKLNSFKTTQPISVSGNEGAPFKLTCESPDGWPKPVVHWIYLYTNGGIRTIDSPRITVDPEGSLWFSNLTTHDATNNFQYACVATSPFRYEYKYGNNVLLNVSTGVFSTLNKYEPVLQYASMRNTFAYLGKQKKLYCIFGGTPLPQTVWSKDGKLITSSDRIKQDNYGKSLIIHVVDFEDEGTYTCEVSNGVQQAKIYSIKLKVYAVPYFTVEPKRINAPEGETAEFHCEAGGVPTPEIKWIHNGKPINEAPPNPRRRVESNRIIIQGLTKADTGNYGCNATNPLGYVYKDVYINVLSPMPPEIVEAPKNTQAVDGQNVTMSCKVLGAPKPSVKWHLNGKELTGGRYQVQANGDLLITNVQFDDSGNYTCYADNTLGIAHEKASLLVKFHTYISDFPKVYEGAAHASSTLRCNVVKDDSLNLEIAWLKDNQPIDFNKESRFVQLAEYSLTITKTTRLDSGTYTCVARTALDEVSAKAQLIVQDIPNPPKLMAVECYMRNAIIRWLPMGDNRAPISHYIVEFNTAFMPETWTTAYNNIPATDMSFSVSLSPWANYTFRVIAVNKIGKSLPSAHSEVCSTYPDVPYKNPDNVKGEGDRPDNLIITWTPMPKIEHNADKFWYRVFWKRDIPDAKYESHDITDWTVKHYVVENQPTFQQYRIKVLAINEIGEANVAPLEVIGWSGENVPVEAPSNFRLLTIQGPKTALLSWNPVEKKNVQGYFKGYKIKTWSDISAPVHHEIQVQSYVTKALVDNLDPFTKNYAQVSVYNGKYNGPASETLSFVTPEGVPEVVSYLDAQPLGTMVSKDKSKQATSAFLLTWKKPEKPNGILRGYNIFYKPLINGTTNGKMSRNPQINNSDILSAKLSGLKPDTHYVIYITARTDAGTSKELFIERKTNSVNQSSPPGEPNFNWDTIKVAEDGRVTLRIQWLPDKESNPGTHFIVKYRKENESNWTEVEVINDDFAEISGIDPKESYDLKVTSVDGDYYTESKVRTINITSNN